MIHEYALEPEMVAQWGGYQNHRFFLREFGLGHGKIVSRYTKKWATMVWNYSDSDNQMDKKRLEELLIRLKETMVRRKNMSWDDQKSWLLNAVQENTRYPFLKIIAQHNPSALPEIIAEQDLATLPCQGWDIESGIVVKRTATAMAAGIERMLGCCRWVKFIDPFFSKNLNRYKQSLPAFLNILAGNSPVGRPENIEIHAKGGSASAEYLITFYQELIPAGIQVTLYLWQEHPGGQKLHNRYIITDLGGVAFEHGLDTGAEGETDDINLLSLNQYKSRCEQYNPMHPAFELAGSPITINGIRED